MIRFLKSLFSPFVIYEPSSTEWAFAMRRIGYKPTFRYGQRIWENCAVVDGKIVEQ